MDPSEPGEQMTKLSKGFPSMRDAPGIDSWKPEHLNSWAAGPASSGERHTARFLLSLWDSATAWEAGRFDVLEALGVWDLPHRGDFLTWAEDPWWP